MSIIEAIADRCIVARVEVENRAVERMLILPGNLGTKLYEWFDEVGYQCEARLTDTVEHMTIAVMPFGDKPHDGHVL